ncbi:MAG: hypothetical protein NT029_04810 [Armatimonadetes bacterium]|nr:hypothetical protein [Armatimonadota bacterium]
MILRDKQMGREIQAGNMSAPTPVQLMPSGQSAMSRAAISDSAEYYITPSYAGKAGKIAGPLSPQGLGANFAGVNLQNQIDAGWPNYPPDTAGAIGPDHFVQATNGSAVVFDRAGTPLAHVSLASFFATGAYPRGGAKQPRIIYDRRSGKWFASVIEGVATENQIILAVSRTTNPFGTWDKYVLNTATVGARTDANALGVDDNGVYFAHNVVGGSTTATIAATRKATLVAATPSLGPLYRWSGITDMFAPQPVFNMSGIGATVPIYFFATHPTALTGLYYRYMIWPDAPAIPTLPVTANLATAAYATPVSAPALGSTTNIDTGDDRLSAVHARSSVAWMAHNVGVNATGGATGADRTGIEWIAVDISGIVPGITQRGRVYDNAAQTPRSYYYPGISVNGQLHVAMGFSGSKAGEWVGAYTCGRWSSDAANTMQAVTQIKAGEADYNLLVSGKNRWGGSSATSLDPNDNITLWTVQEYAAKSAANPVNIWGTWIAALLAPAPTINNPAASAVQGVVGVTFNVTGANFYYGGAAYRNTINITISGDGISNKTVTYVNTTTATVKFDLATTATIGPRDVTFTAVDGQTATAVGGFTVIRAIPTRVEVDNKTSQIGAVAALTAKLVNEDTSAGIAGKTLSFKVGGTAVGSGATDASGIATVNYTVPELTGIGDRVIDVAFLFDGTNAASAGSGTLTVVQTPTKLYAPDRTGIIGATTALKGYLFRTTDSGPITGRTITFTVDGTAAGSGTTIATGEATANYAVPEGVGAGVRPIGVAFAGDASYNSSAGTAKLTVGKANTTLFGFDRTTTTGGIADLKAFLRRTTDLAYLAGRTVNYKVDGTAVGSAVTNGAGLASYIYTVTQGPGQYEARYDFGGDGAYNAGTGANTLTVTGTTALVVANASGQIGSTVTLAATLTRNYDSTVLAGKTVSFKVDGAAAGTGVTDAAGIATASYVIPAGFVGDKPITGAFAGDVVYGASNGAGVLTSEKADVTVTVPDVAGKIAETVALTATVKRNSDSAALAGLSVAFDLNGTGVGSGATNASGVAGVDYVLPEPAGAATITAAFAGDGENNAKSGTGTLTINKAPTALTVNSPAGVAGTSVDITGSLTRTLGSAALACKSIDITVDGTAAGSAVTNGSGAYTLSYAIPASDAVGAHAIGAAFAGDVSYEAATATGTLTVSVHTTVTVAPASGTPGGAAASVSATLTRNNDGAGLAGKSVAFKVDGTAVGSATTDATGKASVTKTVDDTKASSTIDASFAGDADYLASSGSGTLTTVKAATSVYVPDRTGHATETVLLRGYLKRTTDNAWLTGKTLTFKVDGTVAGTGVMAGASGAGYTWTIPGVAGTRTITAEFAGDVGYNASTGSGKLTVTGGTATKVFVVDRTAKIATYTVLKAYLYRMDNSPVAGKTMSISIDSTLIGTDVTRPSGYVQLGYTVPEGAGPGIRVIHGVWAGDGGYNAANNTGKLTVQKAPSYLYAYPRTGRQGATVTLMSYLRRLPDYAKLGGKTIDYTLDGSAIGSAVTGADGIANLTYAIPATLSIANHTIGTSFAGDISYDPSASTGILKMIP